MEQSVIAADIEGFIRTRFSIGDDEDLTRDVNLFDYGFIDSMEATEIIVFLEERFNVEITQKDIILYPMNTINEIAGIVMGKQIE